MNSLVRLSAGMSEKEREGLLQVQDSRLHSQGTLSFTFFLKNSVSHSTKTVRAAAS